MGNRDPSQTISVAHPAPWIGFSPIELAWLRHLQADLYLGTLLLAACSLTRLQNVSEEHDCIYFGRRGARWRSLLVIYRTLKASNLSSQVQRCTWLFLYTVYRDILFVVSLYAPSETWQICSAALHGMPHYCHRSTISNPAPHMAMHADKVQARPA